MVISSLSLFIFLTFIFIFIFSGAGIDIEQVILRDPEVRIFLCMCLYLHYLNTFFKFSSIKLIDLLISLIYCASRRSVERCKLHFPFSATSTSSLNFYKMENSKQIENIEMLKIVLDHFPPVKELQECASSKTLRPFCDSKHELLYPLLKWLILSNRSHLRLLKDSEKPTGLPKCQHVFTLLSGPYEKESKFLQMKADNNGSVFAFHGSPFHNVKYFFLNCDFLNLIYSLFSFIILHKMFSGIQF